MFARNFIPNRSLWATGWDFAEPAWVWSGFGIAFICAVIGGQIQQGMGTVDAIFAILLGNFILFVYSH